MQQDSWFKTYRKILDWEWFTDSNTLHIFIALIALANTREREYKGLTVKVGQLVTSYESLANITGMSYGAVRTAIKHLRKTGEIEVRSQAKFSIITVKNFMKYQSLLQDTKANYEQKKSKNTTGNTTVNTTGKATGYKGPKNPGFMRTSGVEKKQRDRVDDRVDDRQQNSQATGKRQADDNTYRYIDIKNNREEIRTHPASQEKVKGKGGEKEDYIPKYWERDIPKVFWGRFEVEDDYWEFAERHSEEVSEAWDMN